jgi:hypothetical protein
VDVQITKWLHLSFLFSSRLGRGRGGLRATITLKKLTKDGCVITFLDNFIFNLGTIHEKHKFKYLKNLTVKVCKIWCNDVYMSILQCDIFWWKLIDRNFFNPIFNTHIWISCLEIITCKTVETAKKGGMPWGPPWY